MRECLNKKCKFLAGCWAVSYSKPRPRERWTRMRTERSKAPKDITRSLGRGRATPSLFLTNPSKIVRLRGGFNRITLSHQYLAAPLRMTCSNGLEDVIFLDCRGRHPWRPVCLVQCFNLSGVQAASSPMRRAFLLVGVGA